MGNRCAEVLPTTAPAAKKTKGFKGLPAHIQRAQSKESHSSSDAEQDSDPCDSDEDQNHCFAFASKLLPDELAELDVQFAELFLGSTKWHQAFKRARSEQRKMQMLDASLWLAPVQMTWQRNCRLPMGATITEPAAVRRQLRETWRQAGMLLLVRSVVGVILLAGGMDRNAREPLPTAMEDVGLSSRKCIFQVFCERIRRLQHLVDLEKQRLRRVLRSHHHERHRLRRDLGAAGVRKLKDPSRIPMYIMSNAAQVEEVRAFFELNEFFGLCEEQLRIFAQDDVPIFDKKGKALLEAKNSILTCPGGNGAIFQAMAKEAMLADSRGLELEQLFVTSVDNLLAKVADPGMLGFGRATQADVVVKVFKRKLADESFGLLVHRKTEDRFPKLLDEKAIEEVAYSREKCNDINRPPGDPHCVAILEPGDQPSVMKNGRVGQDTLKFRHASACQFVFTSSYFERMCKRVPVHHCEEIWQPYVSLSKNGRVRTPPHNEKNAVLLTTFVADALQLSTQTVVAGYLVDRSQEFAPVRSSYGHGSPSSAVGFLSQAHQQWIIAAGGEFFLGFRQQALAGETAAQQCEVSPLVSYEGEGLAGVCPQDRELDLPLQVRSSHEIVAHVELGIVLSVESLHFVEPDGPIGQMEADWQQGAMLRGIAEGFAGGNDAADFVECTERFDEEYEEAQQVAREARKSRKSQAAADLSPFAKREREQAEIPQRSDSPQRSGSPPKSGSKSPQRSDSPQRSESPMGSATGRTSQKGREAEEVEAVASPRRRGFASRARG